MSENYDTYDQPEESVIEDNDDSFDNDDEDDVATCK